MKETGQYLKRYFIEAWDVAKLQWPSFTVALLIVGSIYCISLFAPPGWGSYLTMFPAALIIALTALARVNDIGPELMGRRWQVRKIGLIMAGAGAVMLMATPFSINPAFPTWRAVILVWGMALTWLTTPGHPPWDYYITGKYRFLTHPPDHPLSPMARIITRFARPMSTEELMQAQAEYEAEQKRLNEKYRSSRRGDGDGP